MPLKGVFWWALAAALVAAAYSRFGWPGVALATGALVMWVMLHITRTVQVLKRAANQPIGSVASAVMLNAKLKPGLSLLHVLALTRALGERLSPEGAQPERFAWTDGSGARVWCEFKQGRLALWALERPAATESATDSTPPADAASNAGPAALAAPTHPGGSQVS